MENRLLKSRTRGSPTVRTSCTAENEPSKISKFQSHPGNSISYLYPIGGGRGGAGEAGEGQDREGSEGNEGKGAEKSEAGAGEAQGRRPQGRRGADERVQRRFGKGLQCVRGFQEILEFDEAHEGRALCLF